MWGMVCSSPHRKLFIDFISRSNALSDPLLDQDQITFAYLVKSAKYINTYDIQLIEAEWCIYASVQQAIIG